MYAILHDGEVVSLCGVEPDADDLASRGLVAVEAENGVGLGWLHDSDSGAFSAPPATASPISDLIKAERDRRIYADFEFGGHIYEGDLHSWHEIRDMGNDAERISRDGDTPADKADWLVAGVPQTFTAKDNSAVPVLMQDMIDMKDLWRARQQRLRSIAARIISDAEAGVAPLPDDPTEDEIWT